jgi:hypothetical protein
MYRQHTAPATGKGLTTQDVIANADTQFTFGANMLFQGNDKTLRQWNLSQWRPVGLGFHFRRMNTAVEIPDSLFSESGK